MARWSTDVRTAAVTAELAPYAWRGLTDRMLARRVVGALDRHTVVAFLTGLPGTDLGEIDPLVPAEPGDVRVDLLVRELADQHWRGLALDRLCADLVAALDAWQAGRDSLHRDLRKRLGER